MCNFITVFNYAIDGIFQFTSCILSYLLASLFVERVGYLINSLFEISP